MQEICQVSHCIFIDLSYNNSVNKSIWNDQREMDILEIHIDSVIQGQRRLEKLVFITVFIVISLAVTFLLRDNSATGIFTISSILFCFLFSTICLAWYLFIRINACMNSCNFIKIEIRHGSVDSALNSMKTTLCTKEIYAKKFKDLLVINPKVSGD